MLSTTLLVGGGKFFIGCASVYAIVDTSVLYEIKRTKTKLLYFPGGFRRILVKFQTAKIERVEATRGKIITGRGGTKPQSEMELDFSSLRPLNRKQESERSKLIEAYESFWDHIKFRKGWAQVRTSLLRRPRSIRCFMNLQ